MTGGEDLALWRAADEVLDRLLDIPEEEREAALASMALEPRLAACVQRLLDAHEREDGPLDIAGPDAPAEGRQLGRWILDEEIGRGGMSVVYRAHCEESGETRVAAVKMLTLGALVAGGTQRFKREQAILARLQHPHIASLIDCGVAEDGTPWLAMPLVDGEPIDDWCDRRGLGVADRVTLMLDVCDAVAYAHRNLVIHRDIKPSNVLVDRDGYVRLLDFGIGGLLESRQAGMTMTRMLAWTPQYAAPEQFRLAPASTAMDVYGLGALLYRLLTGRPPREGQPEDEPLMLPSRACLEDESGLAPLRRVAAKALRGDLDAVLLKALAPDPEDRYRSPDALARDLKAWLRNRPVRARGAGNLYRLRCFLRRHRVAAVAAVLLAGVLGTGLTAIFWQAERARVEAERANAVKEFLVELFESADPERHGGRSPDTLSVLARGAERVNEELAGHPALAAELLHLIGRVQLHLGDYGNSRRQLLMAHELALAHQLPAAQHGATLLLLGQRGVEAGELDEADRWLAQARQQLEPLNEPAARADLALVHLYLGWIATVRGDADHALAELSRAGELGAEAHMPAEYGLQQRSLQCLALAQSGDAEATLDCERHGLEELAVLGGKPADWPAHAATALRRLALARLLLGQPDRALDLLLRAGAVNAQPVGAAALRAAAQQQAYGLLALSLAGRRAEQKDLQAAREMAGDPALDDFNRADLHLALAAQARLAGDAETAQARLDAIPALFAGADVPARLRQMADRVRALSPPEPPAADPSGAAREPAAPGPR